ncbi:MAG: haloacid dehalogenase [Chloroflexota bacterium]|nr:MAG: haloacid dehalogenase [Chloroflexota bacterium]
MHIEAVLFDLDGTLLDRKASLIDFLRWQVEGMLKTEVIKKDRFIERFIALDANGLVWKDQVYATLIDEFSISHWSVVDLLTSYELCFCAFSRPMKGAGEALNTIKNMGVKIGLVSNGKSPFQERNFTALGFSDLFDTVLVSDAVGWRKPEKEIFELACDMLSIRPHSTIFVGDSEESDIAGANHVGMHSIYLCAPGQKKSTRADAVCTELKALPGIIQDLENAGV